MNTLKSFLVHWKTSLFGIIAAAASAAANGTSWKQIAVSAALALIGLFASDAPVEKIVGNAQAQKAILLALVLGLTIVPSHAQNPPAPPAPSYSFSLNANAMPLFGSGESQPATDIGATFQFTKNSALREENIIAPGADIGGYFGGIQYQLPASVFKNTTFSNQFFPYVTGSAGIVRSTAPGASTQNHFGALAGGGLNYCPNGSQSFCLNMVEARWARLPGFENSTFLVSSGLQLKWNW